VSEAIAEHRDWIVNETLTQSWSEETFTAEFTLERQLDEHHWLIALQRVEVT
jgi:hypothetical protein